VKGSGVSDSIYDKGKSKAAFTVNGLCVEAVQCRKVQRRWHDSRNLDRITLAKGSIWRLHGDGAEIYEVRGGQTIDEIHTVEVDLGDDSDLED